MKRMYLVTGANGFLGNTIVRMLCDNPDNVVRALILPSDKLNSLNGVKCEIFKGDVTRIDSLEDFFNVPLDVRVYVIHCAAVVYIKSKYNQHVYDVNVNGTKNIIEKVLKIKAKLIYVNSVHAIKESPNQETIHETYDFNPDYVVGLYAKTKAIAAKIVLEAVKKNNLQACIIHPSGIIGPNDYGRSHLTQLILDYVNGRLTACVKGGYDFVDCRDVAIGIINACEKGEVGKCYIMANKYISIQELLDMISDLKNLPRIKTVLPMWFAKMVAPLAEAYYYLRKQPPLYTRYSLYTLTSNAHFSSQQAINDLDYQNRPLTETLNDTIDWLMENNRFK